MTTINVTAGHIARGKRDSSGDCPVALAIRAAIPGIGLVAVATGNVALREPGAWVEIDLPDAATRFVEAFDVDAGSVEPFSFELDYPAVTS